MTNDDFATRMTTLLKAYVKAEGAVDTGALYNSIKFSFNSNNDLTLNAEPYIKYLDGGELIANFLKTSDVEVLIDLYFNQLVDNIEL